MKTFARSERIADRVRSVVSETLLREVSDPRLANVTIVDVKVTGDLRQAKVYWVELQSEEMDEKRRNGIERALVRATGMLRSRVAQSLQLKVTPDLTFVFDSTLSGGRELAALIERVQPPSDSDGESTS